MRDNLAGGGGPASVWSDRVLQLGHLGENSCIFTTMTQTSIEKNYNRRRLRIASGREKYALGQRSILYGHLGPQWTECVLRSRP